MRRKKMWYRTSAKNRKIKRNFLQIFHILKFEWLSISHPLKMVIIGVFIASFGLFFDWFGNYDNTFSGNAFHKILWISWYILFFMNICILFLIFGRNTKEIIKNIFHFHAKDAVLILLFLLFWAVLSINCVVIIANFQIFKEWIVLGQWLIIVLVGYILWSIWWCINIYSKTKTTIYVNENYWNQIWGTSENNSVENENNMKLPF